MNKAILISGVAVGLSMVATAFTSSGLEKGEMVSPFHPKHIAGALKGRRITCVVHEDLRPTPQMVREALFSILGNSVPGRAFFDVFAGQTADIVIEDFKPAG